MDIKKMSLSELKNALIKLESIELDSLKESKNELEFEIKLRENEIAKREAERKEAEFQRKKKESEYLKDLVGKYFQSGNYFYKVVGFDNGRAIVKSVYFNKKTYEFQYRSGYYTSISYDEIKNANEIKAEKFKEVCDIYNKTVAERSDVKDFHEFFDDLNDYLRMIMW